MSILKNLNTLPNIIITERLIIRKDIDEENETLYFTFSKSKAIKPLGNIKFLDDGEILYQLSIYAKNNNYNKKGFTTEALKKILTLIPEKIKSQLFLKIVSQSDASQKVAKKCGFQETNFFLAPHIKRFVYKENIN